MENRRSLFQFGYRRSSDQDAPSPARHRVVVVGAGPVGLSLAIDLAQRGVAVVLLDDADRIGEGSRGICYAKRTLEIWDRLGVGERMIEKGVTWQRGKVYQGAEILYEFDLLPEGGHKRPAFINLQQFHVENFLVDRVARIPEIDLRWRNKVIAVAPDATGAELTIETPDGPYRLAADWVIACDGARSTLRALLDVEFAGETFEDQFLIADIKMHADLPTERRFWFDPPFHTGQSALMHRQPDDIWRIDLQLGAGADAEAEKRPESVRPRIEAMLGHADFDLEWVSVYKFQCRRIASFVHGRVLFCGDSAHQVSPFGARGANSGVQDAENLAWKLALILSGRAAASLIESYDLERGQAADDNIRHSTRSTDFIAPHSAAEARLRDAALALARHTDFAKRMVNSGRLSVASAYESPLSTPDAEAWNGGVKPGAAMQDAQLRRADGESVFLTDIVAPRFTLLQAQGGASASLPGGVERVSIGLGSGGEAPFHDAEGQFASRYAASQGSAYLLRPDGHVAARFREVTEARLAKALDRACGRH
ncbi:3-(3-hydroxy-phenyl)propionate hydroxylase [Rhizobiales bacterium GAS191]|nr:3-(3-hydroxy-phenyl)propionate hydroxylase [Rhizobiales bacterium GAS191]